MGVHNVLSWVKKATEKGGTLETGSSGTLQTVDAVPISLGSSQDVTMAWDGTNNVLEVLPAVDDTGSFNFGDGTTDLDVKMFLGSTTEFALFDVGNSRVELAKAGLKYTGTANGKCIDFDDVTLAAGSTNNIWSFGDSTAKSVTITDYFFPVRMNVESIANPSSGKLTSLMFLKWANSTADQANLDVQAIGLTCTVAKNLNYMHSLEVRLEITDDVTITGECIAGKFEMNLASAKTLTSHTTAVLAAEVSGAGSQIGSGGPPLSCLQCYVNAVSTAESAIDIVNVTGCTITNAIKIGAGGTVTNVFNFGFVSTGAQGAKVGAVSDGSQDSDGLIRILAGGTAYYIPFFGAGKVTGEW